MVPPDCKLECNWRFGTASSADSLKARAAEIFAKHEVDVTSDWILHGEPFVTDGGPLTAATESAIRSELGYEPRADTGGGTSDGRFIAKLGTDVIELGPAQCDDSSGLMNGCGQRTWCVLPVFISKLSPKFIRKTFISGNAFISKGSLHLRLLLTYQRMKPFLLSLVAGVIGGIISLVHRLVGLSFTLDDGSMITFGPSAWPEPVATDSEDLVEIVAS